MGGDAVSWSMVKIGEAFEQVRNGLSIEQNDSSTGIPITRIETIWNSTIDINRFGYANIEDIEKYEDYRLKDGDILMTHINSPKHLGKCAIYENFPEHLIHGMNLLSLRPNKEILFPKYIFFYLSSNYFRLQLKKISNQSVNQASFSSGNLKKLQIPLPSLPEQKRIAAILDKADSLRRKRQQAMQLADEFLRAVFLELFGDPVTNPKGWEKQKLGNMTASSMTNGLYKHASEYGQGCLIIRIDNFYSGYLTDISTFRRLNITKKELELFQLIERSIVINRVNSNEYLGKSALIEGLTEPTVFESNMMNFTVDESKLNPRFLVDLLGTNYLKSQIKKASKDAVNQSSINQKDVNNFEIILPPIDLQNKYESITKKVNANKKINQSAKYKSSDLFNSLSQKAFAGEL